METGATERAQVVVVGSGISGLVTARELRRDGIEDVLILEAQGRTGGRMRAVHRPNGDAFQAGGEITGPPQVAMQALAAELGVETEPFPPFADFENMGQLIRFFDGEKIVEPFPFASDPDAGAAVEAVKVALGEMATHVPADAPWSADRAGEWDSLTLSQWLAANTSSAPAKEFLAAELFSFGHPDEVSLLQILWHLAAYGGWEGNDSLLERFKGGTAQITDRLAEDLQSIIRTSSPVYAVDHDDDGVVVHHVGGSVTAAAVVFAMEPGQVAKIEFSPRLTLARDRLQQRWSSTRACKFFAVYDTPFWKEDGLAGVAFGAEPFPLIVDWSELDGENGVLLGAFGGTGPAAQKYSDIMAQDDSAWELFLDAAALCFGERALHPIERYRLDVTGERWCEGAGTVLSPGVLSTVGEAVRKPIGRLIWAGAETGVADWMEGAATSGQRAAKEAAALVRA